MVCVEGFGSILEWFVDVVWLGLVVWFCGWVCVGFEWFLSVLECLFLSVFEWFCGF